MKIKLHPSDAMMAAAQRGLSLAEDTTGIEPAAKARARKIAAGESLTPAVVKRMSTFFSENKLDRKPGWEKTGSGIMHMLWGGDAAKAWAAGRMKDLDQVGVALTDDETPREFVELFYSKDILLDEGATVEMDDDGLIWKPILPEGVWAVGPNGRPLRVVSGTSPDQRQAIGMADVIQAFNENAVPHITIPKTHKDEVDENTGYVEKLKVKAVNGIKTLFAGHRFTDKAIKQKIIDGSIANTSVGLEFDYVRKDDGKKFPVVLRHNALTNRPWLGRTLPGFALGEETTDDMTYTVMCGEYSAAFDEGDEHDAVDLWDNALTYGEVRDAIRELTDGEVTDVAVDRALVKKDDKNYVVAFSIDDGDVTIGNLVERNVDSTQEPLAKSKEESEPNVTLPTTSEEDTETTKETTVSEKKKDEETTKQPEAAVVADLAENPTFLAEKQRADQLQAQVDQLLARQREEETDKFITQIKGLGLDEKHGATGLLKLVRNTLLSDTGETALLLAEDGDAAPRSLSASDLVRELIGALPTKDGKLAMQLSEQHSDPLGQSQDQRPPAMGGGEEEPTAADKLQAAESFVDEMFGGAPATKKKES